MALLAAGISAPAAAVQTSATASVTILEPAFVPSLSASSVTAILDASDGHFRQVNNTPSARALAERRPATWPVIIEFE